MDRKRLALKHASLAAGVAGLCSSDGRRPRPGIASALALLSIVAVSCMSSPREFRDPFPARVGAWDEDSARATIAERAREPQTIYAELLMAIESSAASGVFDAVVVWSRSPRRLRMTGFRDSFVSIHDLFDLRIEADRYQLVFRDPERDGEPFRSAGPIENLPAERPELRTLASLREGLFLPGRVPDGASSELEGLGTPAPRLVVQQPDGLRCEWELASDTLTVRRARLAWPDGQTAEVIYWNWESHGGRYFPGEVEIVEPEVRVTGTLRELELDAPLEDEDFRAAEDAP